MISQEIPSAYDRMQRIVAATPPYLYAVDPGKKHCAIARFSERTLIEVTLIRNEAGPLAVAQEAAAWINRAPPDFGALVTEMQECYPAASSKINNDLFSLTFVVGAIHALVNAPVRVQPLPREWKGSTPKAIFTNRIIAGLTTDEKAIVDNLKCPAAMKHNVLDAIGLGKWALKCRLSN